MLFENRTMKTKKILHCLIATSVCIFFAGCGVTVQNLTPLKTPTNPSNIYTFSCNAKINHSQFIFDTYKVSLVINGEILPMRQTVEDSNHFAYDYKLPIGQNTVLYYYKVDYKFGMGDEYQYKEYMSMMFETQLINRYVIQLESKRGPVGSKVGIIGRGFSQTDVIVFNEREIDTEFYSPFSIGFSVPSLPTKNSYEIVLRTDQGELPIGDFYVDSASFNVIPGSVNLASGQSDILIFQLYSEAPAGGLYIDVTTDVPDSIIMPEVFIPGGARTVNVIVEGGAPGTGYLYMEAAGFGAVQVPIRVY